jgi:uncharacterized protein (DUF1810 family)
MWFSKPAGLERFVVAQDEVHDRVIAELTAGHKRSHWMWFVFPQLKDLGRSGTAKFYGLADLAEAREYWQHDRLRSRLVDCTNLVLSHADRSAHAIFGSPDDLKLRSCMTLFEVVAPEARAFGDVLDRFYDGLRDDATRTLLGR